MADDILVSIIADDIFSRNWMSLLVVRDWRTRLANEFAYSTGFADPKQAFLRQPDILLADVDNFARNPGILSEINAYTAASQWVRVIFVGSSVETRVLSRVPPAHFGGYLLKDEIGTSLTWAVSIAAAGRPVFTPSTHQLAVESGFEPNPHFTVLHGQSYPGLTPHQSEIARLAVIFSLNRRDLADELKISDQWSYGVVSELYTRLGLDELDSGSENLLTLIQENQIIKSHLETIIQEMGESKKAKDLETLAFHLITLPIFDLDV